MLPTPRLLGIVFASILLLPVLKASEADDVREKGIAALKDSQANPRAIVDAARLFVKAAALYNAAGNEEKNVEMNSFLYWCKKKMTMADIDAFTKGGETTVAVKLAAVEKAAPKVDEAKKWFDRADQFAKQNPDEHLLIAIRFYEIADRFKGSDTALQAMDRSLKEQLLDKSTAAKTVLLPGNAKPPAPAVTETGKVPVPAADALKQSEKLIKDLFKADYAKTDLASRMDLVPKLLQQADENKGDPAALYVLLHEARDVSVSAGNGAKATEAQNRLRDAFKIDRAAMLLGIRKLESASKTPETAAALAMLLAGCGDEALAAGDYDHAVRYYSRADDLQPLIKDTALKAQLKTDYARMQAFKKESVAALAAEKTLATKPADADANSAAGRFALMLGDFEKCMPLLAKGKDIVLVGLAKAELAQPKEVTEQTKLADGWFERAEKEPMAIVKTRMQERAALWYNMALPGLTGLVKLKVEDRLKNLPQVAAPAAPALALTRSAAEVPGHTPAKTPVKTSNKWISLLPLIKIDRDIQAGNWDFHDGVLSYADTQSSLVMRLRLPYEPATEYDFRVVYERSGEDAKDSSVVLILARFQKQFTLRLGETAAFHHLKGGPQSAAPLKVAKDQRHTAIVQVRRNGVTAFVDDRQVSVCATDFSELKAAPVVDLRSTDILDPQTTLGLGVYRSSVRFYSADVLEVGIRGNLTRENFVLTSVRSPEGAEISVPPVDPKSNINVALASSGAVVISDGRFAEALIDGNISTLTEATCPCEYVIKLAKAYPVSHVRMRLLDFEPERYYQYKIETSPDGQNYTMLFDQSKGKRRSWQVVEFQTRTVKSIRIIGLRNSTGPAFQMVEFEAYAVTPGDAPVTRFPNE